jgi:hypothetical protein
MADAEKLDRGYMGRLLQLTLLAPNIVEVSLDGRQPEGIALPALMEPFPVEWERQFWNNREFSVDRQSRPSPR